MTRSVAATLFACTLGLVTLNCRQTESRHSENVNAALSSDSIVSLAEQAYMFGYPLVLMEATMKISTNFEEPVPNKALAPINQFGHFRSFPDASFRDVVKPNCDTYYSTAWLDLKTEPVVLSVPNTNGRYYLLPMLDAYTNVFASPANVPQERALAPF